MPDGASKPSKGASEVRNVDFRQRMTLLLEDLDAAGEDLAAMHVERALSQLRN